MSKILIILIILVIMFEFTFSSSVSYALDIEMDAESWVNRITGLMGRHSFDKIMASKNSSNNYNNNSLEYSYR
ncbi:MAG: hypothetical protein IJW20_01240 [Clostridia bacterium]|nr:hypothetical protein [Clostridia bacterium]